MPGCAADGLSDLATRATSICKQRGDVEKLLKFNQDGISLEYEPKNHSCDAILKSQELSILQISRAFLK